MQHKAVSHHLELCTEHISACR